MGADTRPRRSRRRGGRRRNRIDCSRARRGTAHMRPYRRRSSCPAHTYRIGDDTPRLRIPGRRSKSRTRSPARRWGAAPPGTRHIFRPGHCRTRRRCNLEDVPQPHRTLRPSARQPSPPGANMSFRSTHSLSSYRSDVGNLIQAIVVCHSASVMTSCTARSWRRV